MKYIPSKGSIAIYAPNKGSVRLEVKLERNTVWLTQLQMADLFEKDVRTISEHIQNVYREGELSKKSTIRKFRIVQKEGKRSIHRIVEFYDFDVIISVGYRVKSQRGTQFRIWATHVLRNYLIRGYALNTKRLAGAENRFAELRKTIALLSSKSLNPRITGRTLEVLELLKDYGSALTLLNQYDNKHVPVSKAGKAIFALDYAQAVGLIEQVRSTLIRKNEAREF